MIVSIQLLNLSKGFFVFYVLYGIWISLIPGLFDKIFKRNFVFMTINKELLFSTLLCHRIIFLNLLDLIYQLLLYNRFFRLYLIKCHDFKSLDIALFYAFRTSCAHLAFQYDFLYICLAPWQALWSIKGE